MTLWDQITDDERERLVATIVVALATSAVPEHLRAGLVRYFADGILPGGFLQAVLCYDLEGAIARHAGGGAAHTITVLCTFLIEHTPVESWGSVDKVLAWTTTPDRLEIRSPGLEFVRLDQDEVKAMILRLLGVSDEGVH